MALSKDYTQGYTGVNVAGSVSLETDIVSGISTASANYTLTGDQANAGMLEISASGASNNVVIPSPAKRGKIYAVSNSDATNVANIKIAGGTAISVASGKSALLRVNSEGTLVRLTADA